MLPEITLTDAPTTDTWRAIVGPLIEFNNGRLGRAEARRPLAVLLTDPQSGEITGGLYGSTVFSYLHVDLLFVPESMRRKGVGRKLLSEAEAEAGRRGCHAVSLDTYSFQARGFYEKMDYATVARIVDFYKPGDDKFVYVKYIGGPANQRPR